MVISMDCKETDTELENIVFELTRKELKYWRSQFATSNEDVMGSSEMKRVCE
jgi:hypothetical protein